MSSARTKATNIKKKVKMNVHERDNGRCIFCRESVSWNYSNAHVIPRSRGGLGIEENIITACYPCHTKLDTSSKRLSMLEDARKHLRLFYPDYNPENYIFKKGM